MAAGPRGPCRAASSIGQSTSFTPRGLGVRVPRRPFQERPYWTAAFPGASLFNVIAPPTGGTSPAAVAAAVKKQAEVMLGKL